jgi:DNA-binding response OmpR family regulator
LYSRRQVDQLRFVVTEMGRGASAADAHRALAQRILAGAPTEPNAEPRSRVLILVAERDEYSAELIEFLLRTEGFGVEVALDVEEARQRYEGEQPDLVVIEWLLGGGDGESLCRWLKDQGSGPVLVISGLDAADRALSAGADAFLRKPVGHLQLLSVVKDLLGVSALAGRTG